MECYNCHSLCDVRVYEMYFEELRYLHKKLHSDLVGFICPYLYHTEGHMVVHDVKEWMDEGDHYFEIRKTHTLCTYCFQKGLYLSLNKCKRLPYLRREFGYFCSDEPVCGLKDTFKHFILPPVYYNIYYPKPFIVKKDNGVQYIGYI